MEYWIIRHYRYYWNHTLEKLGCHTVLDYRTYKEEQYDKLAEHVRSHLNLPLCTK